MSGTGGGGRERRRKGVVNLLRRSLYAVLLWISHPLTAAAADEGQGGNAEAAPRQATIDIRTLPAELPGEPPVWRVGVSTDDPRAAPVLSPLVQRLRSRRWDFDRRFPNLRGGIGLDVDLPQAGNLHLNLLPPRRDNATGQGLRWQLSADESQDLRQVWSIGGTVDRVRSGDGPGQMGDSRLALTPQLILDVDALAGMSGDARLTLQRAQWRDRSGEDIGRVWQVNLRWRF